MLAGIKLLLLLLSACIDCWQPRHRQLSHGQADLVRPEYNVVRDLSH
jgi:hypothetical protein